MRRLVFVIVVLLSFEIGAQAASRRSLWLRRLTLAASCAGSFWDYATTRTAWGRGAHESNGYLSDNQGNPRWGRMVGIKVGLCVGTGLAQELFGSSRHPVQNYLWSGVNSGMAIRFSTAALQNRRVAAELKRKPDYLLKPTR